MTTSAGLAAQGAAHASETAGTTAAATHLGAAGAGHGGAVGAAHAGAIALKASAGAKLVAVLGLGVAGAALVAQTGAVPGLQVALSHVPTWTHAHTVLSSLVHSLRARGSGGVSLGL